MTWMKGVQNVETCPVEQRVTNLNKLKIQRQFDCLETADHSSPRSSCGRSAANRPVVLPTPANARNQAMP